MSSELVDSLDKIIFLLNSRNFPHARGLCLRALNTLKNTPCVNLEDRDIARVYSSLSAAISDLRKCVSQAPPSDPRACREEARRVYRYSVLLNLLATGRIKKLIRARRAAYAAIALGLPTGALFGLPILAIGLIFLGVLWTYFYFVRLKLIGLLALLTSLVLLLPYLVNAVWYFTWTILSQEEIVSVASELGISPGLALLLLILLLVISTASLVLDIYALVVLFRYRVVFE